MTASQSLIDEFLKNGWKSNPFDRLIPLLHNERDQALSLALSILDRIPKGGTFFDLLLSYLTEEEFAIVVGAAVEKLKSGRVAVAESVIAYASVQLPYLLTPFLRDIFTLQPNSGSYYEEWPWRAAGAAEIGFLKDLVEGNSSLEIRSRAWRCLVETRNQECIHFAAKHFPSELDHGGGFKAYANLVGFDVSSLSPRRLHTDVSYHIIFPVDYFETTDRPIWNARSNHPTWSLDKPGANTGHLGGKAAGRCGLCGGALHMLLEIQDASSLLPISLERIELCTCMSCLGWEAEELFFRHDRAGVPTPACSRTKHVQPEFPAEPLKSTQVRYVRSPARWSFQDWALSNGRENLNRIGGAPSWIQDSQYPVCPQCKELMHFVAQLDSDPPTVNGSEWLWGSGGICYLFWCDTCRMSASLWQCT